LVNLWFNDAYLHLDKENFMPPPVRGSQQPLLGGVTSSPYGVANSPTADPFAASRRSMQDEARDQRMGEGSVQHFEERNSLLVRSSSGFGAPRRTLVEHNANTGTELQPASWTRSIAATGSSCVRVFGSIVLTSVACATGAYFGINRTLGCHGDITPPGTFIPNSTTVIAEPTLESTQAICGVVVGAGLFAGAIVGTAIAICVQRARENRLDGGN
jgi:hypothetical protein